MTRIDTYKHLKDEFSVSLTVDEIANQAVNMNYGVHRLLSSLVRAIEIKESGEEDRYKLIKNSNTTPISSGIRELLNKGYYY